MVANSQIKARWHPRLARRALLLKSQPCRLHPRRDGEWNNPFLHVFGALQLFGEVILQHGCTYTAEDGRFRAHFWTIVEDSENWWEGGRRELRLSLPILIRHHEKTHLS